MKNGRLQGFTLMEMSIVLVIIGVLTGSIIYGKSLLMASRLQAVITDANSYITAAGNFKQAYQGLPGDLPTATSLWGAQSGCPLNPSGAGTCNGNGDGMLAGGTTYTTYFVETLSFWSQLYDAGMYNAALTGIHGSSSTYQSVIGTNVPRGSVDGSGFSVLWFGLAPSASSPVCINTTNCFSNTYGNVLLFGGILQRTLYLTNGPILTADQAASIDAKIDDGLPGSGNVMSYPSGSTFNASCSTTASASTAQYNVAATGPLCSLIFLLQL